MCPEACLDPSVKRPQYLKHMKNQGFPIQLENTPKNSGSLNSDESLNQHFEFFTWISKHLAKSNLKPHNITTPTNFFPCHYALDLFYSANIYIPFWNLPGKMLWITEVFKNYYYYIYKGKGKLPKENCSVALAGGGRGTPGNRDEYLIASRISKWRRHFGGWWLNRRLLFYIFMLR